MNSSSEEQLFPDFFTAHPALTYGLIVPLVVLTVLGTCGNTLVILSVCIDKQLQITANVFVVNLALADLGICLMVNPFSIAGLIDGHRIYRVKYRQLCTVIGSICLACCIASLLNIMVISINRCIAVARHRSYNKIFTLRNSIIIAVMVWLASWAMEMPNHFGWGDNTYDDKAMVCVYDRTSNFSYTLFITVSAIGVPCLVILICYAQILYVVLQVKHKLRGRRAITRQVAARSRRRREAEARLARTLFFIFLVFIVCWIPYGGLVVFDFHDRFPKPVHAIMLQIAHANSGGINAMVYTMSNEQFRAAMAAILRGNCWRVIRARRRIQQRRRTMAKSTPLLYTHRKSIRRGAPAPAILNNNVTSGNGFAAIENNHILNVERRYFNTIPSYNGSSNGAVNHHDAASEVSDSCCCNETTQL